VKGLQIWAHSHCRSVLRFYAELGNAFGAPVRICIARPHVRSRSGLGWPTDEFSDLEVCNLGVGSEAPDQHLRQHHDWHQLFGVYQIVPATRRLILKARDSGCPVGIGSEAPLNMHQPGLGRILKAAYVSSVLPLKVSRHIAAADFILNYSGTNHTPLSRLGWPDQKILPAGYFSPPLVGSSTVLRTLGHHKTFKLLCTGGITWHRGQDVLVRALALLRGWGFSIECTMTQHGPMEARVRDLAIRHGLNLQMPGLVSADELIRLYEECSCFVGAGRAEPWGLRLNDALHCGSPLIVSSGMGGMSLVNEYECGLIYRNGDHVDLAWQVRALIESPARYLECAQNAIKASQAIVPKQAAIRTAALIRGTFPEWA
jgi:glycosyltransferase involved in cell wall biosynthesis